MCENIKCKGITVVSINVLKQLLSYLSTQVEESDTPHIAMSGDFNANLQPGRALCVFGDELQH